MFRSAQFERFRVLWTRTGKEAVTVLRDNADDSGRNPGNEMRANSLIEQISAKLPVGGKQSKAEPQAGGSDFNAGFERIASLQPDMAKTPGETWSFRPTSRLAEDSAQATLTSKAVSIVSQVSKAVSGRFEAEISDAGQGKGVLPDSASAENSATVWSSAATVAEAESGNAGTAERKQDLLTPDTDNWGIKAVSQESVQVADSPEHMRSAARALPERVDSTAVSDSQASKIQDHDAVDSQPRIATEQSVQTEREPEPRVLEPLNLRADTIQAAAHGEPEIGALEAVDAPTGQDPRAFIGDETPNHPDHRQKIAPGGHNMRSDIGSDTLRVVMGQSTPVSDVREFDVAPELQPNEGKGEIEAGRDPKVARNDRIEIIVNPLHGYGGSNAVPPQGMMHEIPLTGYEVDRIAAGTTERAGRAVDAVLVPDRQVTIVSDSDRHLVTPPNSHRAESALNALHLGSERATKDPSAKTADKPAEAAGENRGWLKGAALNPLFGTQANAVMASARAPELEQAPNGETGRPIRSTGKLDYSDGRSDIPKPVTPQKQDQGVRSVPSSEVYLRPAGRDDPAPVMRLDQTAEKNGGAAELPVQSTVARVNSATPVTGQALEGMRALAIADESGRARARETSEAKQSLLAEIPKQQVQPSAATTPTVAPPSAMPPLSAPAAFASDARGEDQADVPVDEIMGPTDDLVHRTAPQSGSHSAASSPSDIRMSRHVASQIVQAARQLPDRPVEISLNPEELGRVRMTMHTHDGSISVALSVERADTADLLRRNLDSLTAEFKDLGYRDISFSFSGGGTQQQGGREQGLIPLATPDTTMAEAETQTPARIRLGGGVDLRL